MGARDLAAGRSLRGGRRDLLAPLALLVGLVILSLARPLQPPSSPRGVAHCLGAASLARDHDLRFDAADASRYEGFVAVRPVPVLLAKGHREGAAAFPGNPLAMAWVASFVLAAGLRGALLAHALALVLAMGVAAATLRQRFESAWTVLLACLFGSVAIVFLVEPRPETLVLAALVTAFALAYRGEAPRFEELSEVYDDRAGRPAPFLLRWILVGALLAFAVVSHPVYSLFLLPLLAAMPPAGRGAGAAALGAGAAAVVALVFALVAAFEGAWPWVTPMALFDGSSGLPGAGAGWADGAPFPSLLDSARPVPDATLIGWNLLFVALGRSVGAVPYFLPALLLLALWEPRTRRSALVATAALVTVVTVVVWPFDFAGDAVGIGNAVLLPVFGALWLVPTRRVASWAVIVVVLVSGAFLWPSWLRTVGLRGGGSASEALSSVAQRWLPHETTRRPQGGEYSVQGALRVLPAGGGLAERGGRLLLTGGQWGSLVLASTEPLTSVRLSFDGQAGSELEVAGGALGDTLFAADGGVGFEIELAGASRSHPMWWSSQPQSLYDLRLRLPRAPGIPVAFRIVAGP